MRLADSVSLHKPQLRERLVRIEKPAFLSGFFLLLHFFKNLSLPGVLIELQKLELSLYFFLILARE